MRKQKVYIETSIISHLEAVDVPDRMGDTLQLWREIRLEMYEIYISDVVITEIEKNSEERRNRLTEYLSEIKYTNISINDEIKKYAHELIRLGILSDKHLSDCLHIGAAVVHNCDMLLSWNFRHMVKVKTINGIKSVSSLLGYKEMGIYPPSMIIEGGEE